MCGSGRGALAVELLLLLVLLVARGGGAARPLAAARTVALLHDDTVTRFPRTGSFDGSELL